MPAGLKSHAAPRPQVERHWASFWHEAELMSRLNHPNVLRFYGLVVNGPLVRARLRHAHLRFVLAGLWRPCSTDCGVRTSQCNCVRTLHGVG